MHDQDHRPHAFWTVLKRVLKTPLALGLLSVGVLGMLLQVWGPFGFGAALAAVMVYAVVKLQDRGFVRDALQDARAQDRRTDATRREFRIEELDVESRVRMKTIVKLQEEIRGDVESSPVDEVAVGLAETVEQTDHVVARGLALSQKRGELLKYLRRTDDAAIEARICSLQTRLAGETDPVSRSELESAVAAKQRELDDFRAIEQSADRVLGQLDSIEASFASLRARLVRIKSTDIDDWVAANQELRTELGGLNSAVDTVEQSVNEVLTLGNSS